MKYISEVEACRLTRELPEDTMIVTKRFPGRQTACGSGIHDLGDYHVDKKLTVWIYDEDFTIPLKEAMVVHAVRIIQDSEGVTVTLLGSK